MKKIRLDLEALKVESFVTSEGTPQGDGTVFGMLPTDCEVTCNGFANTCDDGPNCFGMSGPTDCCDYTNPMAVTCTGYEVTEDPIFCGGGGDTDEDTCPGQPGCKYTTQGPGGW